jgi:Tfp pilus assembly PilM family ATPase
MPIFHNHVGINLTETKLQLVEISYKQNSFYLENVGQKIFKEQLVPTLSESKMISILQESFEKINNKKSISSNFISFCLPNNFFKIVELPFDNALTKKDLQEHLKWELSILFPDDEEDKYFVQNIDVNKTSVRKELRTIIFALEKRFVKTINKFCKGNGLELKFVDNSHLASNAFLHLNKRTAKDFITLSLYIDQVQSSIAALEGHNPFYFKIIDERSNEFNQELGIVIAELSMYDVNRNNIGSVILNGLNITSEFEKSISTALELPIIKINPFERLKIDELTKNNPLFLSQYNSFTAATGIAIRIV